MTFIGKKRLLRIGRFLKWAINRYVFPFKIFLRVQLRGLDVFTYLGYEKINFAQKVVIFFYINLQISRYLEREVFEHPVYASSIVFRPNVLEISMRTKMQCLVYVISVLLRPPPRIENIPRTIYLLFDECIVF